VFDSEAKEGDVLCALDALSTLSSISSRDASDSTLLICHIHLVISHSEYVHMFCRTV
jgi:hypothetical protein